MCALKQQPQEQPQKSHKEDILQKPLQIHQTDRSINLCVLWDGMHTTNYFVSLGVFMRQGCRTRR